MTRILLSAIWLLFSALCATAQQGTGPIPTGAGNFGATINSNGGHVSWGGGAPPSLNAACGTGAVITGTDSASRMTSGTGSGASCLISFAVPWNNVPSCSVDVQSGSQPAYSPSASGIVLSGVADSSVYNIICIGRAGG